MCDEVRQALAIGSSSALEQRTIDVTTTGRRSGEPRRIEIVFYRFEDRVYLGREQPLVRVTFDDRALGASQA